LDQYILQFDAAAPSDSQPTWTVEDSPQARAETTGSDQEQGEAAIGGAFLLDSRQHRRHASKGELAGGLANPVTVTGGVLTNRRLHGSSIENLLKARAEFAMVAKFSPHDCRRTFVSNVLDAGVDLVTTA
jgi:hypothetical protein